MYNTLLASREFFDEVKDKKILLSSWQKDRVDYKFFIPRKLKMIDGIPVMKGELHRQDNYAYMNIPIRVYGGFNKVNPRGETSRAWMIYEGQSHMPKWF